MKTIQTLVNIMLVFVLSSCGLLGFAEPAAPPAVVQQAFIPLPPPEGNFTTAFNYIGFGQSAQLQRLISSQFSDEYSENGSGIGKITSEKITLQPANISAVTTRVKWGDWAGGIVSKAVYNDLYGNIVGGMIELTVEGNVILPIFKGEARYIVDRSVLSLVYARVNPGDKWPTLVSAKYQEYWGPGTDIIAQGASVTWHDVSALVDYQNWLFWENGDNPFTLVTNALQKARDTYSSATPDFVAYDQDSIVELIGRQTGMHLFEKGEEIGTIEVVYDSLFGPQPNVDGLTGAASLSEVIWTIRGKTYTMLVLAPIFDRQKTTLYILLDDPTLAAQYKAMPWPSLYKLLRQNPPGVLLAVYAIGQVKEEVSGGDGSVTDAEGNSQNVHIDIKLGKQGAIQWVVLGDPTYDNVLKAHQLINLGGEGFLNSLGWGFPYAPGSGSGINFYVSLLRINLSPNPLAEFGQDVGLINRVGFGEVPSP